MARLSKRPNQAGKKAKKTKAPAPTEPKASKFDDLATYVEEEGLEMDQDIAELVSAPAVSTKKGGKKKGKKRAKADAEAN
ncbi:hypothetical protein HK104_005607, partial [Borealophlyctis nickersoniae]